MIAESQYGDNTMEATRAAIQQISKEPADEYFVIVFSDANFSRYGIRPSHFASSECVCHLLLALLETRRKGQKDNAGCSSCPKIFHCSVVAH